MYGGVLHSGKERKIERKEDSKKGRFLENKYKGRVLAPSDCNCNEEWKQRNQRKEDSKGKFFKYTKGKGLGT